MKQILTIASNTFIEVIRQPVYLIIVGCSMGLILLSPYFTLFAMLDNNKMVKDMGLSTLLITGLLLAAFSASSVIYKEIENKTILTIISKPVSRFSFILGKYLGLGAGLLAAHYLLTLVFVHVVRTEITEAVYSDTDYPMLIGYIVATLLTLGMAAFANFFYQRPFTSSAVLLALPIYTLIFLILCFVTNEWKFQSFTLDMQIVLAAFFIFLASAVFTGLATAASTRLGPISTLFLCISMFFLGLLSDHLLGRQKRQLLFVVSEKCCDSLEQGIISKELKGEFSKNQVALFKNSSIETMEKGNKWKIVSGEKKYFAFLEQEKLSIYQEDTVFLFGYKIIPNFQVYWVADAVSLGHKIPMDYFWRVFAYTLLVLMAELSLAVALFLEKETQ